MDQKPPHPTPATIRLKDLELACFSVKLRRTTRGHTCLLAALSEHPTIEVDCHEHTGTRSHQERTQRPKAKASTQQVLPVPPTGHPLFWLVIAARDGESLRQMEALERAEFAKARCLPLLRLALGDAVHALRREWKQSVKYAAEDGLLPLCWDGTRALEGVA